MNTKYLTAATFTVMIFVAYTAPAYEIPVDQPLLGRSKNSLSDIFTGWSRSTLYEKYVDKNALRFENSDLIIVVDLDAKGTVEGVTFLSQFAVSDDQLFVNQNEQKLLKWAVGSKRTPGLRMKDSSYGGTGFVLSVGHVHTPNLQAKRDPPGAPAEAKQDLPITPAPGKPEDPNTLLNSDKFWQEVARKVHQDDYP